MKAFLKKWKPPSRKEWDRYSIAKGHGPIRQYLPSFFIAILLFFAFMLYLILAEPSSSFVGRKYHQGAPFIAVLFPLISYFYLVSDLRKSLDSGGVKV